MDNDNDDSNDNNANPLLGGARRDHQKNRSDIVNTVKRMLASDGWGDEKYRRALEDLVRRDEELVREVARIIMEKRAQAGSGSGSGGDDYDNDGGGRKT